jgi:predicted transcriptional regulator
MSTRIKRTFNLTDDALRQVRELAESGSIARSQDGVVETAIDELYRRHRAAQEAEIWARAAADPEFGNESRDIAIAYRDITDWPA